MGGYYKLSFQPLATCFTLLLLFIPAYGQVTTGDITGRITDEQGHLVPGATITATKKGTGSSRTAVTNENGEYIITQLPAGKYDLTVEAKSFSKLVAQDFELNVGAKATQNFELKPGEVTATVQVASAGVAV